MTVKSLFCPNCHAQIDSFDETAKQGLCPYCESVVYDIPSLQAQYTEIINPVKVEGVEGSDDLFGRAITFIDLGEIAKAQSILNEYTEKYPGHFRGWHRLYDLYNIKDSPQALRCLSNMRHLMDSPDEKRIVSEIDAQLKMLFLEKENTKRKELEEKRRKIEEQEAEVARAKAEHDAFVAKVKSEDVPKLRALIIKRKSLQNAIEVDQTYIRNKSHVPYIKLIVAAFIISVVFFFAFAILFEDVINSLGHALFPDDNHPEMIVGIGAPGVVFGMLFLAIGVYTIIHEDTLENKRNSISSNEKELMNVIGDIKSYHDVFAEAALLNTYNNMVDEK